MHALEKETATLSSILAWRIPGAEEPGGLQSMGSQRVRHNWSNLAAAVATAQERKSSRQFIRLQAQKVKKKKKRKS